MGTFISDISKQEFPITERISGTTLRHSLLAYIQKEHPDFKHEDSLSGSELNYFLERYISDYLANEVGELSELENTVLASLKEQTILADKLNDEQAQNSTFGQRIADKVASFGGSWTFIISFMTFLVIWIALNVFWLANKGFDPYPFILLNLILSSIAALQAPVIMMSQNRQEEKDRERGKKDYMINLKSELEIRMLHEKIDHLILHQAQELMELQAKQLEKINDILKRIEKRA